MSDNWPDNRLRVDPRDNVLIGAQRICRYLGIASLTTLWRWIELYGLPVIKRPDGQWMTTMTSVDQWIFMAAEIGVEKHEASRNANVRAEMAIKRLQKQIDADPASSESFVASQRRAALRAARGVGLASGRKDPKKPYLSSALDRNVARGHHPLRGTQADWAEPNENEELCQNGCEDIEQEETHEVSARAPFAECGSGHAEEPACSVECPRADNKT